MKKLLYLLFLTAFWGCTSARYITGFGYREQGPGEIASLGYLGIDIAHWKLDVPDFAKQNQYLNDSICIGLIDISYIKQTAYLHRQAVF